MRIMRRLGVRLAEFFLVLAAVALASCDEPVLQFHAAVQPAYGHVPYDAQVVCTALSGEYCYELPDGEILCSASNTLAVTIDRLDWQATVRWSDGRQARSEAVSARGTNAVPRIVRPQISGDRSRWYLKPRERTLIDFTYAPATLSGPESGVAYDGSWRVVSIEVNCELKSLCGVAIGDSTFCPPRAEGEVHALWGGRVIENACVVYPLYTSETAQDGLPYAPAAEAGYTCDTSRVRDLFELMVQQNAVLTGVAFPEQTAVIRVVVEDEWGRLTSASFEIPVRSLPYKTADVPWRARTRFYFADRSSKVYHLAWSDASDPYALTTCAVGCGIRPGTGLYFCREGDAIESGRQLCASCEALR